MFYLSSITLRHKNSHCTFIDLRVVLTGIAICRAVVGE